MFALPQGPAGWGHPALRLSGWPRPSRLAGRSPWAVGAGFIPPGDVGAAAGAPGTMQASSPTGVATPPILRFPGWWLWFPRSVGRAFTPAAPWWFQNWNIRAAARSGGMRASRPAFARLAAAIPVGRTLAAVCRGGPWPSRGCLRRPGAVGKPPRHFARKSSKLFWKKQTLRYRLYGSVSVIQPRSFLY